MTKNMAMSATQGEILERLIEAMETDIALPVRVGPKAFGSAMPEYIHSMAEDFARRREDIPETGGARIREDEPAQRRQTERRRRASRERVQRMEEAFDWVRKYIWDTEKRQVLLAYATVKALGWEWSRYLNNRNKRNPKKTAWVKRTVQRWIVKALQIIEAGIYRGGTTWPFQTGLQVAHETARHTGKSITSDLHAWTPTDEKAALMRM